MPRPRILVSLSIVAACASPLREPLPLDGVVRDPSGPYPFAFRFSPDGTLVTYLLERKEGGLTDLWAYDVAAREHRTLLRADGKQSLSAEERAARERRREGHLGLASYEWNPRGGSILLPISGDLHRLEGGALTRLAKTAEPELDARWSPDGTTIAFVRGGNLFAGERALTTDGGGKVRNGLAEFIAMEELDRHEGFWWSPDSARIAYVRVDATRVPRFGIPSTLHPRGGAIAQEYPRAGDPNVVWKLGIVPAAGGETTWMKVEDEYLARVDWMNGGDGGGAGVAVQTIDRLQKRLRLWRCDAATGEATLLHEETDPAWVELHDDARFLEDGRIVWTSERTGSRSLFILDQGVARPLLEGEWLVQQVVGVDARNVYFTAQEGFPRERHLYRVALSGGAPERLTHESGWHSITASDDCSRFLDAHSRAGVPPRFVLLGRDGTEEATLRAPPPSTTLPKPEFALLPAEDGSRLHAMVIRPPASGRRPAVVHVYGGPAAQLVADRWGGGTYLFHARLAQLGFVVLTVDNRGSGGRGRDFARMLAGRFGDVEVADQVAGARWLAQQPYVDCSRIAIWGWSYGGTTTLHCLQRAPEVFARGVAVAPVTDWRDYDTAYTERYLGLPSENSEAYARGSPIAEVASLRRPLLLVHGFADDNVHFRGAAAYLDAAQRAGVLVDQDFWPRGAHGIGGPPERKLLFRRIEEFLGRRY